VENIIIKRQLRFSPDTVFRALSETPALIKWFGKNSEINPFKGGEIKWSREVDGEFHNASGVIEEIKNNEFILCTFSWETSHPANEGKTKKPSILKMETKKDGLNTELIITQSVGEDLSSGCESGWNMALDALQGYLESIRVSHNWGYDWSYFTQSVFINSNIEKVFQSFVDSQKITQWFVSRCEWNPKNPTPTCKTGDAYKFEWPCGTDQHGTILTLVENKQFQFSFGTPVPVSDIPVEVNVTFHKMPSGYIRVNLTQSRIPTTERAKVSWHLECSQGWMAYLQNLKAFAEHQVDLRDGKSDRHNEVLNSQTIKENLKSYGTIYYVKDVEKSAKFYESSLSLKIKEITPTWAELEIAGGNSLCLHQTRDAKAPTQDRGILVMKVRGLKNIAQTLSEKNGVLGEIHEVHPGGISIDLRDPDNNLVSLYENLAEF